MIRISILFGSLAMQILLRWTIYELSFRKSMCNINGKSGYNTFLTNVDGYVIIFLRVNETFIKLVRFGNFGFNDLLLDL